MSKHKYIFVPFSFVLCLVVAFDCGAADETFVGRLALLVDEEIADEVGIKGSRLEQLIQLVDDREAEALDMALSMRDLAQDEQQKKLAEFRSKSEEMGLKLLSAKQIEALKKVRLRRMGMSALGESDVATMLRLTEDQRREIDTILASRDEDLSTAGASKAVLIRANYDRELKSVLSQQQMSMWTKATAKSDSGKQLGSPNIRAKGPDRVSADAKKRNVKTAAAGSGRMQFSFRYAPWQSVIEWFAEQCELSLLMDAPPQGTFNYTDPREYSPAQAIDLLNSVLLTKGYTLVRREKILQVVNLEDGIPPNLVTEVREDELDGLGEYELVRCLFTLQSVDAEAARSEIENLLGPQGTVNVLSSSNQLSVTETAGRLRTFRRILKQGEVQNASALGQATLISLQYVRASRIINAWRKLMGLTEEENATPDGALRVTQGKSSKELLVSGKANNVKEFDDLVKLLDVPAGLGARDVPQLEVYSITEADPESVLSVIETLLEGIDEVRLATDPKTGSLVALARPAEHQTIRATIDQLQSDRRQVEVIKLRSIDPQLAMLSIEKLFGPPPGSEEEGASPSKAPIVDADPVSRSLMIRGSEAQIEDIRTLLSKMGEDESSSSGGRLGGSERGNLRMIPIDAATAKRAMEQLNTIWPTMRKNQIRTVIPSAQRIRGMQTTPSTDAKSQGDSKNADLDDPNVTTLADRLTRFVSEGTSVVSGEPNRERSEASQATSGESQATTKESLRASGNLGVLPEIVVNIGDQGLIIASEDTQALDEFEELFLSLSDRLFAGSREMVIYYLRYAKAEVAGEFVKQFIGASGSSSGSGGGTLLGSLASAALGGSSGSGIIGSLLGGSGGSGGSSVSLSKGTSVIADPRLNALVIQATPAEIDFIKELLQLLDRANSPSVIETVPRPRAIPVFNTSAEEVAEVVRSVYSTRLASGSSGGRRREPSPEDFIKAMTGQKNTGKQINDAIGEQVRITISVDTRRNALIVIATESLFQEIKDLVSELDFATPELQEVVRYGSVSGSSPEMIRNVIETLMDEESNNDRKSKTSSKAKKGSDSKQQSGIPNADDMRRRMEFFRALQKRSAKDQAASQKKAAARLKKK